MSQTGIDGDVSDAELAAFLHECQRRKLDPFTRQIYLIGRYDKRKGRKVYRSQTSIDGFRLIARRAADKSGIDYSYEDTIWFDDDGQRHEMWLSREPSRRGQGRGRPQRLPVRCRGPVRRVRPDGPRRRAARTVAVNA